MSEGARDPEPVALGDPRNQAANRAAAAEFNGSTNIPDLVQQLRARARLAVRRANWFFGLLIFTLGLAFLYYVALPDWLQLKDAERKEFQARADLLSGPLAEMDTKRNAAWQALIERLTFVGTGGIDTGVTGTLFELRALGDNTLVAVGRNGAITSSTDGGETWLPHLSWIVEDVGVGVGVVDIAVLLDSTLLLAGQNGEIVRVDDRHARPIRAVQVKPGSTGDAEMRSAINTIPDWPSSAPITLQLIDEFETPLVDRPSLESQRNEAQQQANEIGSGGFSLRQRRQDFEDFMAICRSNGASDTEHCVTAYTTLRAAEEQDIWQILAERAPPAILILFLLATLGGLYRYNLRMSGFHASRADLLELLKMGEGDISKMTEEQLK